MLHCIHVQNSINRIVFREAKTRFANEQQRSKTLVCQPSHLTFRETISRTMLTEVRRSSAKSHRIKLPARMWSMNAWAAKTIISVFVGMVIKTWEFKVVMGAGIMEFRCSSSRRLRILKLFISRSILIYIGTISIESTSWHPRDVRE